MARYVTLFLLLLANLCEAESQPYWPSQGAPNYNDEQPYKRPDDNPGEQQAEQIFRSYEGEEQIEKRVDDVGETEANHLFNSYEKKTD